MAFNVNTKKKQLGRTKVKVIFTSLASESTLVIIVSVAVSIRTSRFEYSWIINSPIGTPAGFGSAVTSCATVFVGMESVARGVAGDDLGAIVITDLQF